jgi:enamine deaminase RidA (YjgF/YER057c/UK114 family)
MSIERHETGPRMSQVVVHNGVAHLAGQVGSDPDADVKTQTEQTLEKIDRLLALAGTDKSKLLSANIWLPDIAGGFAPMNEAWSAWVPEGSAPARATVQSALAADHWKVEIMVTAAVD